VLASMTAVPSYWFFIGTPKNLAVTAMALPPN
jgi:hypothetical protein